MGEEEDEEDGTKVLKVFEVGNIEMKYRQVPGKDTADRGCAGLLYMNVSDSAVLFWRFGLDWQEMLR